MEEINFTGLPIFSGMCCCYNLVYTEFPGCIGCHSITDCLCVGSECCLKSGAQPITCEKKDGHICQLGCYFCGVSLKNPSPCMKSSTQLCCCVQQMVFPCDDSMPCIVSLCCLTLYPKPGCMVKYGQVEHSGFCSFCISSSKIAVIG